MKRILLSLLILQIFLPVVFIAGCVSGGKTGTLEKDNLSKENILKGKIGMQYWMMKNKSITFYYTPSIPSESFATDDTTSFVVEELIIKGSSNTDKFYKVKTMPSGKTAYLLVSILNEDYHFYTTWLSTEDPKVVEERLKEEQRLKEEVRKFGISEGKSLWLRYPDFYETLPIKKGFLSGFLEEVKVKDFDAERNVEGNISIKLYLEKNGEVNEMAFGDVYKVRGIFYTENPFPEFKNRWGKGFREIIDAIANHRFVIGMTVEQAILSVGSPNEINRSVGSWGVHEQWVYNRGVRVGGVRGFYLYFENGKLTSWQE